jgi:folate-dependent phosphoribosylglycinamide formyltransferase PurN
MNVAILTQDDHFAIPGNIARIFGVPEAGVVLIAVVDAKGALVNRKDWIARGFGIGQTARLGFRVLLARAGDLLDRLFAYRMFSRKLSIRAVARKHRVPFLKIADPNAAEFRARLQSLKVELVVSFSAPCVFRPELLALPAYGCVNLHCSLLPRYAGLFPSFWVLYHQEKVTGATVHYMDDKIDNGAILGQTRVPIRPNATVFDLVQKTKAAGGELMVDVLRSIVRGEAKTTANLAENGSYFSWPSIEQMREFRKRGGRLI